MDDQQILAIDPGNIQSAWVLFDGVKPLHFEKMVNASVVEKIRYFCRTLKKLELAIEYMTPRGMPTSKEEMDTQFWAGRFVEAFDSEVVGDWHPIRRLDVKLHLCGSARAKDPNIRQAIIDRYEPTGGGKTPQIGTKAKQGPLYGVSNDVWSALAIAITFSESRVVEEIG